MDQIMDDDSKILIIKDNQLKVKAVEIEEEAMIINEDLDISTVSQEDEDAPLKKRLKFMEKEEEEEERVNSENIIILTNPSQQQQTTIELSKNKVPSNAQILRLGANDSKNVTSRPLVELQQDTLLETKEVELGKRILQVQSESDKTNDNEMDMKRSRVSPIIPHSAVEIPILECKGQTENVIPPDATDEGEEVPVKDELEECVEDEEEVYDEAAVDSNDECDYRNDYPDDNDNDYDDEYDDGYRYGDYGEGPTYHNGEDETYAYADGEEIDPLKKFSALKLLDDGGESSPSERYGGDDDSDYDDVYGNDVDESYDYGYNV